MVDEIVVVNNQVNRMSTATNGPRLLMRVTEVVAAVVTVSTLARVMEHNALILEQRLLRVLPDSESAF